MAIDSMSSLLNINSVPVVRAVRRNWMMQNPPAVAKVEKPLKFGILGAANIAPLALITPARTHPEVVVHAIAARDKEKATAFAKKHSIPEVKDSYQALLDDPSIDAVYIPLPNGLHLEWALKALAKGKHVLLEKPSTANATEAGILFRSPLLQQPNAPVLMEALHSLFAPAWRCFMMQVDPPNISKARAVACSPGFVHGNDDIRFSYDLAGGSMMDIGTYPIAAIRGVFGTEPEECTECALVPMPPPHNRCDGNFKATFKFANGGIGEVEGGLQGSILKNKGSPLQNFIQVEHKPVIVKDETVEAGTVMTKTRKVVFTNFMLSGFYHKIDVEDEFIVTKKDEKSKVLKKFIKKETKKAYTFRDINVDQKGEDYWQTYRYMLEQFVNRIRGRESTVVEHEDSIGQMETIDMAYGKSVLGLRPTSEYRPSAA